MGSKPKPYEPTKEELRLQAMQLEELRAKSSELEEQRARQRRAATRGRSLVAQVPQQQTTLGA